MPVNTTLEIEGVFSSTVYSYVRVTVQKCNAKTNSKCASQAAIDSFFKTNGLSFSRKGVRHNLLLELQIGLQ